MRSGSRVLLKAALQEYNTGGDRNSLEKYYTCDVKDLVPELSSSFVQLSANDEATQSFVATCKRKSSNICLQFLYGLVQVVLGPFLSQTTINGLLERGKMFVFSQAQLKRLLSTTGLVGSHPIRILDIGSGDGNVTDKIRSLFQAQTVHVTETSKVMQRILKRRDYKVLNADSWHNQEGGGCKYDLISCLNVLDRCDSPLSMLRQITESLRPGGILVIALVHPYAPFVEQHMSQSRPSEELPISNASWERGVSSLWEKVLKPLGYAPVAVSRVPYICEGDFSQEYYALDDAVLVLEKTKNTLHNSH